jgi:phage FluMu protein Com
MPISLSCPQCNGKLRVADDLAGKKIKCPKCSAVFPTSPAEPSTAVTTKAPSPVAAQGITSTADSVEELEEVEELQEVEELEEARRARRRRIRRDPADEAISTLIPYRNGRALAAYYFGVFSLIPILGLLLGPTALVLGILGLRYVSAHPTAKGTGHAIAGIVLGGLTTLGNWGVVVVLLVPFLKEGVRAFA